MEFELIVENIVFASVPKAYGTGHLIEDDGEKIGVVVLNPKRIISPHYQNIDKISEVIGHEITHLVAERLLIEEKGCELTREEEILCAYWVDIALIPEQEAVYAKHYESLLAELRPNEFRPTDTKRFVLISGREIIGRIEAKSFEEAAKVLGTKVFQWGVELRFRGEKCFLRELPETYPKRWLKQIPQLN